MYGQPVGTTAFTILFGGWAVSAVAFWFLSARLARHYGVQNDGCLLGGLNTLLAMVGGLLAYAALSTQYPLVLAASVAGSVLLPGLNTWRFVARMRRIRRDLP